MMTAEQLENAITEKTKYVKTICAYVKRNPKVTVEQLLKDEDYSPIEALHKD